MELMNDLIPPDVYKYELAPVDLQRDILLCQKCPNVNCRTKKLDSFSKERRYPIMFLFDEYAEHQHNEEHTQKL